MVRRRLTQWAKLMNASEETMRSTPYKTILQDLDFAELDAQFQPKGKPS